MVLAPSVAGLFKWRQFEPEVILLAVGWYLRFSLSYRDVEELLAERGLRADQSPSGGGSNVTPQKFSGDCDRSSDRPTTAGGWMRPTSGLRANGCIYIGLSTPPVRRSTSFFRLNAMQRRPNASSPKPWAERTIRRRGSSTPTSTPVIRRRLCNSKPKVLWRRIAGIDRCSTSINVLEQDHRAIKRRIRASQHFRSFWGAWRTIVGYEAIHMIRKGQACWSAASAKVGLLHRFILGLFAAAN